MMKKPLMFSLWCLLPFFSQGQGAYNQPFDSLKVILTERPELYSEIATLFFEGDTTLEFWDYYILYYGSAFQEDYAPYSEGPLLNEVRDLLEKEKWEEAIAKATGIIKSNPAFADMYYQLGVAYDQQGDSVKARRHYLNYVNLLSVPFNSGNGTSFDSAFVVRSVGDEYLILEILDLNSTSQSLVHKDGIPYDVLEGHGTAESGEEIQKDVYFNIYQPFTIGLTRMFDLKDDSPELKKKEKKAKKRRKNRD